MLLGCMLFYSSAQCKHALTFRVASDIAAGTMPLTTCVTPLFVGILNDISGLESLAASVAMHNSNTMMESSAHCAVQLHVLDNTGCGDTRTLHEQHFQQPRHHLYFDAHQHLDVPPQGVDALSRNNTSNQWCREWSSMVDRITRSTTLTTLGAGIRVRCMNSIFNNRGIICTLTLTNTLACHHKASMRCLVITLAISGAESGRRMVDRITRSTNIHSLRVSRGIAGTHTFGQSMNWFLLEARRTYRQDTFLWAHTDVVVADPTIFAELLHASSQLIRTNEPFSYLLTSYDALCVVHANAILSTVGMFDEFMWYYGEVDLMLRAELAGLPMFQWDFGDKVSHHAMSSMRRGGENSRFHRSVTSRVELWRLYYNRRWEQEFHIRIESFLVTFLHMKFWCDTRVELPLRRVVDAIGVYLKSPARLTIRGASFQRRDGCELLHPVNTAGGSVNQFESAPFNNNSSQLISSAVVYFLPVEAFDQWYDPLAATWEKHRGEYIAFLKRFGVESINFFQQQFDKK
ncbi:Hypothetical protein, putative [Bodo saltans]|uniref:Uncharacterized protein n=1 Tax=Bodo saltans TaxID=75058 RepID=A0A0S4J9I4_BODSA|nr:Hypothetical protein, putative [Bodo saltans]|eukprot:CUG86142.1 Hypothetical protein, putative [Bodo saltans]